MGVKITGKYLGKFQTELEHTPSSTLIQSDAPTDNGGLGSKFSPTDMLSASYAACMMTIMGLRAEKKGINIEGLQIDVTKHMTPSMPRKIAALDFEIKMPSTATAQDSDWLLNEAKSCPVALSVHPEIALSFVVC